MKPLCREKKACCQHVQPACMLVSCEACWSKLSTSPRVVDEHVAIHNWFHLHALFGAFCVLLRITCYLPGITFNVLKHCCQRCTDEYCQIGIGCKGLDCFNSRMDAMLRGNILCTLAVCFKNLAPEVVSLNVNRQTWGSHPCVPRVLSFQQS